ncbi:MAG: response regulator [Bacteroidota bacterium]
MAQKENSDPHIKIFNFKLTPYIGVGKSLFLWFLAIAVLPLVIVSYINYMNAFEGLTVVAERNLVNSSSLREDNINSYFQKVKQDLNYHSGLQSNRDFLKDLRQAYLSEDLSLARFMQSEKYENIKNQYHEAFSKFRGIHQYDNVFLIDIDGNVLYSATDDKFTGTNVYDGPHSASAEALTAQQILETGNIRFSDFKDETHDEAKSTGIVGKPVYNSEKQIVGMVAISILAKDIKDIVSKTNELSESRTTYIIGEDLKLRAVSINAPDSALFNETINHKKAMEWLNTYNYVPSEVEGLEAGKREIMSTYQGLKGEWVYGIARNISMLDDLGVHWAIIEELEHREAFAYTKELSQTVIISLVITVLIVILLSIYITQRTVSPIKKLSAWAKEVAHGHLIKKDIWTPRNEVGEMKETFNNLVSYISDVSEVAQRIAKGDFSGKLQLRSEEDVLAISVNQMIDSFRGVVNQANTIARGDYSANVEPRSEKDTLGQALENMTRKLRESAREIREQDWLKSGISELNAGMSGKKNLEELGKEISGFMASYLHAQVGLIYIKKEDKLKLIASYALQDNHNNFSERALGEGLVGQAAQSHEMIVMDKPDSEEPKIDYTIEQTSPKSYLVAPFVYEGELIGVVQIGSNKDFTPLQKQLFKMTMNSVAVAVNAAIAHTRLQELLQQSQEQQEKLEVQQEELRQTNEELEEQAKALKASENTLHQQKEELSVINEELEERTKALEREKDKIKEKNQELESARKQIEQKAADLEKASRYKSEFLANMSHELRTPLNSILVLSQLMMRNENKNLTEKQVEFAKTINTSGNDLLELINEILDLSKVEAGKLKLNIEKIDLQEICDNIERSFRPVAQKKGLDFHIALDEDVPQFIYSDPQRMIQVVKNLMSNALKFTEQGYVKMHIHKPGPDFPFRNENLKERNPVAISVIDTGVGIPADKQELIFEAFQQADGTTSRKYGGTGLGLSISKSFALLLEGEMNLQSEEGKGTTFTLVLPEAVAAKKEPETEEQPEKTDSGQNETKATHSSDNLKKNETETPESETQKPDDRAVEDDRNTIKEGDTFILIIEDDPKFAKILYDMAGENGFKSIVAHDGETGMHYADYYSPSAIILDVMLPGIDGWEVMARLKNNLKTRHIPVHFVSATDKSLRAMKMGAIGYLTKPVTSEQLEKLFRKISDVINREEKKLLVIDDEAIIRKSIEGLVGKRGVNIKAVGSGREAFKMLKEEVFDLVILDLGLEDMSGFDLLEMIKKEKTIPQIPVIVYTGQELTQEEEHSLKRYAESIIIKGARSPERLLAETTLFLHKQENELPEKQQEKLQHIVAEKQAILKNKHILLADDDMRNLFALSSVLESHGMKITMARNGKEALEKLEAAKPPVDLVLMDIMMPEMDGYEAIRRIRKMDKYEDLPVIALTAKAMKNDREKTITAGASDYLAKPIDNEKLISMLRVWLYNNQ